MSLPIETYRPIDTILRSDYLEWEGIRKPCCSEIVAQDTREARYLSRFDNAGRRGSCFKFAMREIRNYVRVGNWCDPAATDVYIRAGTYVYIRTQKYYSRQTMDEFPFGRRGRLRRVQSSSEKRQTGRGTIKSVG